MNARDIFTIWMLNCFEEAWFSPFSHCDSQELCLLAAIVNTLRPWQNGRHFPDNIFKCIFLNENIWVTIKISLKFVPKGPINNIPALVQIMAWRRPGDKPLSEPMRVSLLSHICVTRPRWVKHCFFVVFYWGKIDIWMQQFNKHI